MYITVTQPKLEAELLIGADGTVYAISNATLFGVGQ